MKALVSIAGYSLLLLALFLGGCVVRGEETDREKPGQAFTAGERRARRQGKKNWHREAVRTRRIRLDGRAEYRSEKIIPSRLEYFQGNPHLSR